MNEIDITIIMPVYNEQRTIKQAFQETNILDISKEIIVVNDGSTDRTNEILSELEKENNFTLLTHKKNLGKGMAVRKGIENAKGKFIIIRDCDVEQKSEDIVKMLRTAKEENINVVFGTRILNWGYQFNIRFIANMLFAFITNILFHAHQTDIMTGYKLCETEIMKSLKLKCNGFDIEAEITAKLLKKDINICEIPISYNPRVVSDGKKICFSDSFKVVVRLLLERITK